MKTIGNFDLYPKADINRFTDEHYKLYQKKDKIQPAKLITSFLPDIEDLEKTTDPHYVFIDGRTGCGKSTYFITQLFKHYNRKIIVLEPRINLTVNNALSVTRKTSFNTDPIPEDRIGWQNSITTQKPLYKESVIYVTTQIMNNYISSANSFKDTIIVVDEVHQLDLPMMLMLWNLKKNQHKFGLVLMMSATANFERLAEYFDVDLTNPYNYFRVYGRSSFEVTIEYHPEITSLYDAGVFIGNYIKNEIKKVARKNPDEIHPNIDLAYILPTKNMFKDVEEGIKEVINTKSKLKYKVLLLKYSSEGGSQSSNSSTNNTNTNHLSTTDLVFKRIPNTVKIILTTPAIEVGQTIGSLKTVVDSGLVYKSFYSPLQTNQFSKYNGIIQPIAKPTQIQRFGRVGRVFPGNVICMYSEEISNEMNPDEFAENLQVPSLYVYEDLVFDKEHKQQALVQSEFEKYKAWFEFSQNLIIENSLATTLRTITDLITCEQSQTSIPQTVINMLNKDINLFEIMMKTNTMHNELLKSSINTTYKNRVGELTPKRILEIINQTKDILKSLE